MTILAFVLVVAAGFFSSVAAQSCLPVDACLVSPTRQPVMGPIGSNGCSVPSEAGPLGAFYAEVFKDACDQHDIDWGTFAPTPQLANWFVETNNRFYANMLGICTRRTDLIFSQCSDAAAIFTLAVSQTSIAVERFKGAQYFASTCACRELPGAPTNLMASTVSGPSGGRVDLSWTAGSNATSYSIEPVQPLLPPIDTGGPAPAMTFSAVPSGTYGVRVRAVNPLGVSAPSNTATFTVGTVCTVPSAPSSVAGQFASGTATLSWVASAGATSYLVRAGSTPGASDLFDGNVGNLLSVSAGGLPPNFHAYARVYAVSSCGISPASQEVEIGGSASPSR